MKGNPSKDTTERILVWMRANMTPDRPRDAAWYRARADHLESVARDERDEQYSHFLLEHATDARTRARELELKESESKS